MKKKGSSGDKMKSSPHNSFGLLTTGSKTFFCRAYCDWLMKKAPSGRSSRADVHDKADSNNPAHIPFIIFPTIFPLR